MEELFQLIKQQKRSLDKQKEKEEVGLQKDTL